MSKVDTFEKFKKVFDESFGKVTPKEFIQRMENLGYKFQEQPIKDKEKQTAIAFTKWKDENKWVLREITHPNYVGKYWSDIHCVYKTLDQLHTLRRGPQQGPLFWV
jgi:hypothetical protein